MSTDEKKKTQVNENAGLKAKAAKKGKKKKGITGGRTALVILILLLVTAGVLCAAAGKDARRLLDSKDAVKAEAGTLADSLKILDFDSAEQSAARMAEIAREDAAILDKPLWRFAAKMPVVGGDLKNVRRLLDMAQDGVEKLFFPALDYLRELPELPTEMDSLKEDPMGAFVALDVGEWMDTADRGFALADDCLPLAHQYLDELADFPVMKINKLENTMAPIREYAAMGQELLPLAEEKVFPLFREELLPPVKELMEVGSFQDLLPEEGIVNVSMLSEYLDILEEMMPLLRELPEKLSFLEELDAEKFGPITEKLYAKLDECLDIYDQASPYLPLMRKILGSGEDKLYLLAAQNTAEIRGSGGFPGAAGYIRVQDGILKIDDLTTGYEVFAGQNYVTPKEIEYFLEMCAEGRDSTVNPCFPIVAKRWAENYEDRHKCQVDGVISITPAIISDLLYVTGPITVSDGTVVDGENVIRFIGNEIYIKYLKTYNGNFLLTDQLMAEIAMTTLHSVFDDISLERLSQYISIFEKRTKDRVIMLWMGDEEGEEMIRRIGCDGGFNSDPTHPQVGVFFTNYYASKIGYYLTLDVELGDPTRNEEGGYDYPMTVHVENTLDPDEIGEVGQFIIAQTGGTMGAQLYFAAPAGGNLSNIKGSCGYMNLMFMLPEEYGGNMFAPSMLFPFPAGAEATITCTVSTAPGQQEPLTYVTTPTYQEFR